MFLLETAEQSLITNEVLCSCVGLKMAGRALMLDFDRARKITNLIILPDLGVTAVMMALGLSQLGMAGVIPSGVVVMRYVGHMFPFR